MKWLRAKGRRARSSSALARRGDFDFFVFFSYRYYHAWHGAGPCRQGVLVPTAERDPAIGSAIFRAVPRRARAHVQLVRGARADPARQRRRAGVVVGVGSRIPRSHAALALRKKLNARGGQFCDLHRPH
jgi:hypothetical protein